jgi:S1-C subfamily serine protease
VLVTGVERGSPAERGGLREGDIIIGLAGEVVSGIDDLQRVLTEDRIGERVEAVVLRKGRRVALDLMPDESR